MVFRAIVPGLVMFFLLGASPQVLSAQQSSQSEGEGDGRCFTCEIGNGNNGCPVGTHTDFNWFVTNDAQGEHHGKCAPNGCVHLAYTVTGLSVRVAKEALKIGTDEAWMDALERDPTLRVDVGRSAIQIVAQSGDVVFHTRIPKGQADRLTALLAAQTTVGDM